MYQAKIGIALGGGAARGWAHIGVLRALRGMGIVPDVIAGTSIGAVVGGCLAADRFEALEDFALSMTPRRMFGYFDFNLTGSGLINGQRLSQALEEHLGETRLEDLEVPFTAVATEIGTGHEVWLRRGHMVDALRASYAIPGIFKPVQIDGRWLFDGALVNPIPVSVCRALGANYVIAVNLNADLFNLGTVLSNLEAQSALRETIDPGYVGSEDEPLGDGEAATPASSKGWGARQLLQRQLFGGRSQSAGPPVPSISTVMIEAFNIVHDRIARSRLAGDPPDILISPKLAKVGLFDFHRAEEMIKLGEVATRRSLANLREDLAHDEAHDDAPGEQSADNTPPGSALPPADAPVTDDDVSDSAEDTDAPEHLSRSGAE